MHVHERTPGAIPVADMAHRAPPNLGFPQSLCDLRELLHSPGKQKLKNRQKGPGKNMYDMLQGHSSWTESQELFIHLRLRPMQLNLCVLKLHVGAL